LLRFLAASGLLLAEPLRFFAAPGLFRAELGLFGAEPGLLRAEPGLLRAKPLCFFGPPQRVIGQGLDAGGELLALEPHRRARIEPEPVLFDLGLEAELVTKKADSTSKTSQRGLERGLLESPAEAAAATG
jgi:hypothetical protein